MYFCDVQMEQLWGSPFIERCSIDQMTTMLENGDSQQARFFFPAFRFIEQQNETISTYYLHCITRLCERSTCSTFKVIRPPPHTHTHSTWISTINPHLLPDLLQLTSFRLVWSTAMQEEEECGDHCGPGEHHWAVCAHSGYKGQDRKPYVLYVSLLLCGDSFLQL